MAEAGSTSTSTRKGEQLRGRRVRDTAPEVALWKAAHRLRLRFRLQRRIDPVARLTSSRPDTASRCSSKVASGTDAPEHCPEEFRGPNAALWQRKIAANGERDRRNTRQAVAAGWIVVRI